MHWCLFITFFLNEILWLVDVNIQHEFVGLFGHPYENRKPTDNSAPWRFQYNQPAASIIIIILSDYQKLSSNLLISKIPQLVVVWFDWKCSLSPDVTGSLGIIYVLGWFNAPRSNITLLNAQCFHPHSAQEGQSVVITKEIPQYAFNNRMSSQAAHSYS